MTLQIGAKREGDAIRLPQWGRLGGDRAAPGSPAQNSLSAANAAASNTMT